MTACTLPPVTIAPPLSPPSVDRPPEAASTHAWKPFACATLLLIVTATAFLPTLRAQFLSFDDTAYVSMNPQLRTASGLHDIWNPFSGTKDQYYPLVFTSFWLEYRLWGNDSRGYHAVNVALHVINVVLVMALIEMLGGGPWVALGGAAIFALHPMQVASVAWIAERKNVLSGFFYLTGFLLYLRHRHTGRWRPYAECLLAFVAALLSKTQTLTLPLSLLLVEYLLVSSARLRPLPAKAIAVRIAPMLLVAALAAVITTHVEHQNVEWEHTPPLAERPFIAATVPWFYAAKFLVPIGLAPIYPRWHLSATAALPWIAVAAWPLLLAVVLRLRRRIGALILWGLGTFVITLAPVLGLVPFGLQQHTYVADHFVYLALIGAAVAVGVAVERLARAGGSTLRRCLGTACTLILLVYALQTYREAALWYNDETFWQHVIAYNPTSVPANQSLGFFYRNHGRWQQALPFFRTAAEVRPDHPRLFHWYMVALEHVEGPRAVVNACDAKLRGDPQATMAYVERAQAYEQLKRPQDAGADYEHVLRLAAPGSDDWRAARHARERLQEGTSPRRD